MATSLTEREDKYDVAAGFAVPNLAALSPQGRVEHATEHLESTYYDTADHDLRRQQLTLRRRAGTTDAGWQLKVPAGVARTEIRLPPSEATSVPDELADLLLGVRAGKELRPIATLKVERTAHRLMSGADLLAEIADDAVHATVFGAVAVVSQWREVEVELGTGDEQLLTTVGKQLRRAGATASAHRSKIGRALDDAESDAPPTTATLTAGDAAMAYLRAQHAVLLAGDLEFRRGGAPVHDTRVAVRRFRSTLRTFATLFEPESTATLDADLAWFGQLLGEVRDREVQRAHFAAELAEIAPELVLGPVAARIEDHLLSEQLHHEQALRTALTGDRYLSLLRTLAGWARIPATGDDAAKPPKSLVFFAEKADRKATRRLHKALAPGGDDAMLHRARKTAKRARYAAELVAELPQQKAARFRLEARVKALKKRQDLLGEQHDSVEAAALMRLLGITAGTTKGENGFTFGLLYERERERSARARSRAAKKA